MSHITPYPHRRLITQAVHHLNSTTPSGFRQPSQIIVSQTRILCSQSSLLLVPYSYMHFLPLLCFFLHILLPELFPPAVLFSPFPHLFYSPLPTQQWGVLPMLSQKGAHCGAASRNAARSVLPTSQ